MAKVLRRTNTRNKRGNMHFINIDGLNNEILVFDNKDDLCFECSYPLDEMGCNSCNIFHNVRNRKFTGGEKHFAVNLSAGKYHDIKTTRSDTNKKYNLARLIIRAKSNLKFVQFCADLLNHCFERKYDLTEKQKRLYVICPVPDSSKRPIQKGVSLAESLGNKIGINVVIALTKIKETKVQHKLKIEERFKNVKDAFEINKDKNEQINGKLVLLTDDIMSTMATQNECAKILMENGAIEVISLTVGRRVFEKEEEGSE